MKKTIAFLYLELFLSLGIVYLGFTKGTDAVGQTASMFWFVVRAFFGA